CGCYPRIRTRGASSWRSWLRPAPSCGRTSLLQAKISPGKREKTRHPPLPPPPPPKAQHHRPQTPLRKRLPRSRRQLVMCRQRRRQPR
ncbi:unnamed protein product, partial [Ectocarpus sp. 4 AP-2014]